MPDPKEPALFSFFNEIGIIDQLAQTAFEEVLPDHLTVSQFSVLNHLIRLGDGKKPSDLASAFQVTRGAMTNTLSKLSAAGLVKIRVDPEDGRGKRVFVTARGRKTRELSLQALSPLLVKIEKKFPVEAFLEVLPFLQQVRAFLDSNRDLPNSD